MKSSRTILTWFTLAVLLSSLVSCSTVAISPSAPTSALTSAPIETAPATVAPATKTPEWPALSEKQKSVLRFYNITVDTKTGELTQTVKVPNQEDRLIPAGRLEADGLHVTDYITGTESVMNPETIVTFNQNVNKLYRKILTAKDTKDNNIMWAFNPDHGWFKPVTENGTTVDAEFFYDGRYNISELLRSKEIITKFFPPDAVSSEQFLNIERDYHTKDIEYAYVTIAPLPGTGVNGDYKKSTGWMNEENRSFHLVGDYKVVTPVSKTLAPVESQWTQLKNKTYQMIPYVYNPGEEPIGDDSSQLIFPYLPPPKGTEARTLFELNLGHFEGRGQKNQIGWEFGLKGADAFWDNYPYDLNRVKDVFANKITSPGGFGGYYLGPLPAFPALQQSLWVPGRWQSLMWPENTPTPSVAP